ITLANSLLSLSSSAASIIITLFTTSLSSVVPTPRSLDSLTMVCMWTCGDVFKTAFFLLEHAPLQFPLCGALQICLDCLIFAQHFYYTNLNRSVTVLTNTE
ncbi:uncharacterized protein DEA37_0006326, partial [Paragonimus westermani]